MFRPAESFDTRFSTVYQYYCFDHFSYIFNWFPLDLEVFSKLLLNGVEFLDMYK